jgi:hypothetical protein
MACKPDIGRRRLQSLGAFCGIAGPTLAHRFNMSGGDEDRAIPLITVNDDGKFVLHEDALDFVSASVSDFRHVLRSAGLCLWASFSVSQKGFWCLCPRIAPNI